MTLDRFYPIFDHADWLRRMLPLGVKLVQLRIKDQSGDVVKENIEQSRDLCRRYGAVLVVNDYWQLAIELGCDWLHLGQEDLDEADLKAIHAAGLKLGVSTHDEDELDLADDESLPWLEAGEDEEQATGFDTSRMVMLGVLALVGLETFLAQKFSRSK